MNSEVEINGRLEKCEFIFSRKSPIAITGPGGPESWQQNNYDARVISPNVRAPGKYTIYHNGKRLVFEAVRPYIPDGMLGYVLESTD